jgi:hypothetical protein
MDGMKHGGLYDRGDSDFQDGYLAIKNYEFRGLHISSSSNMSQSR